MGSKPPSESRKEAVRRERHWVACGGVLMVAAGKKRNGKPHNVLLIQELVCVSEADAKRVAKEYPSLKFVERKGTRRVTARAKATP